MPVPRWLRKRDHVLWDTADVIIKRVGEEAYAVKTDTREVIAHSKDHAEVWNSVVESNRRIAVFDEFTFTNKVYKQNLENVEIFGRAKIKIVGDGYPAIHLVDPVNVKIWGLKIDGGGQSSSDAINSGILIETVDRVVENIEIKDCEIYNVVRAGVLFAVTLTKSSTTNTYGFRNIKIRNNYIHDMTKGDDGIDGNGIWVARGYAKGVRIIDNRIENMLSVGVGVASDTGFGLFHDVVVEKNHIINARYYGLDLTGIWDAHIVRNYIYNDDNIITGNTYGIFIETADINPSGRVTIEKNIVDGAGLYGIYVYSNNHDIDIVGNITRRIKNPSVTGARHIVVVGERVTARNNRVYGDEDGDFVAGIEFGAHGKLLDNIIYKVTDTAILVYEKGNLIIRGNHIVSPSRNGIRIVGATGCIIEGNYIEGIPTNYYGIVEENSPNINSDYNIIKNNVLRNISGTAVSTVGTNTIKADNITI